MHFSLITYNLFDILFLAIDASSSLETYFIFKATSIISTLECTASLTKSLNQMQRYSTCDK